MYTFILFTTEDGEGKQRWSKNERRKGIHRQVYFRKREEKRRA